ncbi:MAG TPA: hypothetical protein VFB89_04120 [Gemmatimonadales bacterium]|nr:hypothetical protein [Gemmatimonadales bacterium]
MSPRSERATFFKSISGSAFMSQAERRSSQRVPYRTDVRPLLVVEDRAYEIIDVGERGIRARCADTDSWLHGSVVHGSVWFQRDRKVPIEGLVVRAGGGELALKLAGDGIPVATLIDEARYARISLG